MAWLWKQRRPTLLAVVGLGVLGYTVLHKEGELGKQGQASASVRGEGTAHLPLRTPTPEAKPTESAFLGSLGITPTTPLSLPLCFSALTMGKIRLVIAPLDPGHKGEALLNRIRLEGQHNVE